MIKKRKLFGLAAVITAIVVIAIIGVGVASCSGPEGPEGPQGPKGESGLDGLDGDDGKPGDDGRIPTPVVLYNVTYTSNGGNYVDPEKVVRGGKATMPATPVRPFTTSQISDIGPGLYLAGDGGWFFKGWCLEDGSPYNFDAAVSTDIDLFAEWSLPSKVDTGPDGIDAIPSAADFVEKVCDYIRTNAASYILAIDRDYDVGTLQAPVAGLHLTIAGIDGRRKITSTTTAGRLFNITTGASLILGNNITLQGKNSGDSWADLIYISNGTLIMEEGSKITGHKGLADSKVINMTGATSRFIMNGGEISDNQASVVFVSSSAEFIMNNGIITENKAITGVAFFAVWLDRTVPIFTMNGGEISNNEFGGVYALNSGTSTGATFTMNAGIITGNTPELTTSISAGGVFLTASSNPGRHHTFIMNGGSITGNDGHQGDVFIGLYNNAEPLNTLTLSGNAEIKTLTTSAGSGVLPVGNSSIIVTSSWTGSVENLYLYGGTSANMADTGTYGTSGATGGNGWWATREGTSPNFTYTGKQVISPAPGYTLTTADMAKFINLDNAKFMNNQFPPVTTSLDPGWFISTLAGNRGRLVKR
jgi:hypothetical protein